jgi:hypothetical protein
MRVPEPGDLPPPNTKRWGARLKAAVVVAVRDERITIAEALLRYQLSEEEFRSWQFALESYGLLGLRATWLQLVTARLRRNKLNAAEKTPFVAFDRHPAPTP